MPVVAITGRLEQLKRVAIECDLQLPPERLLQVPFTAALERRNRRLGIRAADASPLELADLVGQLVSTSESALERPGRPSAPEVDAEA